MVTVDCISRQISKILIKIYRSRDFTMKATVILIVQVLYLEADVRN